MGLLDLVTRAKTPAPLPAASVVPVMSWSDLFLVLRWRTMCSNKPDSIFMEILCRKMAEWRGDFVTEGMG